MKTTRIVSGGVVLTIATVGTIVAWELSRARVPVAQIYQPEVTVTSSIVPSATRLPAPTPNVVVNGQPIKPDAAGNVHFFDGQNQTQVHSAGDQTMVMVAGRQATTHTGIGNDGQVNISVDSANVNGASSSMTQVFGNSFSSGSSSDFQYTSVTTSGQSNVQVNK